MKNRAGKALVPLPKVNVLREMVRLSNRERTKYIEILAESYVFALPILLLHLKVSRSYPSARHLNLLQTNGAFGQQGPGTAATVRYC